jgi:uncharacterized protein (DUF342 family)
MANLSQKDQRFGDIAVDMQLLPKEKLERALVVQDLIFSRTKVHMPIGKVLKEMGVLDQGQIDNVLAAQKFLSAEGTENDPDCTCEAPDNADAAKGPTKNLSVTITKDKLSAFISPNGPKPEGLTLEILKEYLEARSVVFGLVDDAALEHYLAQEKLPMEPFKVASGVEPVPGTPPEVIYHFDTDPLRIGTLQEDGTMDWKNRGDIPQVKAGDLLVEKTKGDPGKPGTSVCGKELPPPRLRNPNLKCGKGAQRSEDGFQILAKIDGTPKLSSDGKVFVFDMLNIDGDIGVETGNIEYKGHIEATGGVNAGYTVKAKGLRTEDIQDAVIEVDEDLVCHAGMYGSTIKVGGSLKAGHIHNCTIEVLGELVVEKEIYESTIETNTRCLIVDGKIIDSKIDAKKGIYAKNVGSEGSNPCRLTVGFDRKYEREMADCKTELDECNRQIEAAHEIHPQLTAKVTAIGEKIEELTREQEKFALQKRQFEEQLRGEGPNAIDPDDEDQRAMLEEMIAEFVGKNEAHDAKITTLKAGHDKARSQLEAINQQLKTLDEQIEALKEKMALLTEAHKVDPGIAEIKIHGTITHKTEIIAPHKEMTLQKDMQSVRIAESKVEPESSRYHIKISNLR